MSQKGIAMVMAIVLALIVSVTAAVVLSLTMRRFELSAFRTDHAVAAGTAEAGFQYAFARLDQDTAYTDANFPGAVGFAAVVQAKRNSLGAVARPGDRSANDFAAEYVLTCDASVPIAQRDELVPALHMGAAAAGKHVTLRIRFFTAGDPPPVAGRQYRVRSFSDFGTGGQ